MESPLKSAVAACVLAALIGSPPYLAKAQDLDRTDVDPLSQVYHSGAVPEDELVQSRRAIIPRTRAFLPLAVDLAKRMPAVGNQGASSSCVAWATAYAARSYYTSARENRDISEPANLPSPTYVYHRARRAGCDDGTTYGDVVNVLKDGAVSLAELPFTDKCVPPPSPDVVSRAHDFRVQGLTRVDIRQPDDVKGQLAQGNPVLITFHDSTAWQHLRSAEVFHEPAPPSGDRIQGWHAMTIVGYDERRQAFRLINSWGKGWGDHGYAWFGYDLLQTRVAQALVLNVDVAPQPHPQPGPEPGPAPALAELQALPCAHVNVGSDGGRTVLSGYVASDDDLAKVRTVAAAVPNVVVGDMIVAPWPQCEALQTLERPLGVADRPAIDIGPNKLLREGEPLRIEVRSPSQISYLYVSYIQADGSVVHLVQPSGLVPQPTLPRQTLVFGTGEGGRAKFKVSAPFGREMIIAIASRSPLFDHELPQNETERDYLTALRRALVYKPSPDMPDREVAAAMTTLQTSAR